MANASRKRPLEVPQVLRTAGRWSAPHFQACRKMACPRTCKWWLPIRLRCWRWKAWVDFSTTVPVVKIMKGIRVSLESVPRSDGVQIHPCPKGPTRPHSHASHATEFNPKQHAWVMLGRPAYQVATSISSWPIHRWITSSSRAESMSIWIFSFLWCCYLYIESTLHSWNTLFLVLDSKSLVVAPLQL